MITDADPSLSDPQLPNQDRSDQAGSDLAGSDQARSEQTWLADRLTADTALWERLGFTGQDLADIRTVTDRLLADPSEPGRQARARAVGHARRLPGILGEFVHHPEFFGDKEVEAYPTVSSGGVAGAGWGVLALVGLAAAVPELQAYHREHGVPDDVSWATVADLGQQARVHRETFGEFGLHTHGWLTCAWSGALYTHGRLQFNLYRYEALAPTPQDPVADPTPRWVLSTHIPGTGPLTPEAVDDSFARAGGFFDLCFPDHPTTEFYCASWLLDPRMGLLAPESNTARFQARWQLDGPGNDGNTDAFFFLWRRRDEVDPATLPTDSSLRRLVISEITAGRPWQFRRGLIRRE